MKDMDMTNGNIAKKILIFTIPIMLSSILQLLFNTVDMIVIGNFAGDASLAAVGSTSALINLIVNLFIGISIGANVVVSRAVGQKNLEKAQKATHTAILFSIIAGAILIVFGVFTSRIWLELMGTTSDSIDKATTYLQIYFAGSIFNMVYNFGASILKSVGETKRPLIYLFIAGVMNALLNLLFVIAFKMDVAGVALATVIAQGISAILVIIYLMKREGFVNLKLRKLRIYKKELGQMVLIGIPAGIQSCLISFSNVFIQSAVNSFDSTIIVSGNTAAANIEGFVWVSMNSFYQAAIAFTGQNYGANKIENSKKILGLCMIYTLITGVLFGGGAYLLRGPLINLYTSGEAVGYGEIRLTIICLSYFLCGLMDLPVGSMRGLGNSIAPMIISILGMVVFRIIWIATVFYYNHELWVLYISYPITWVGTGTVHYLSFLYTYKNRIKKMNSNTIDQKGI
ncbi:MAG: MATE family efflux transporter [Acholeplasmatales bacterium]|nr:MATE family efflux transporter [Acholeplasmatales bacterium]